MNGSPINAGPFDGPLSTIVLYVSVPTAPFVQVIASAGTIAPAFTQVVGRSGTIAPAFTHVTSF